MSTDPDRIPWLADQTGHLILAAVDRDADTIATTLGEIGARYGHDGIYGVCCALATAVHQLAFPGVKQGDGSLTGDILAIEKLPGAKDESATEWACRFVTSHINGDGSTNASLFFANLGDEDLILGGVVALVAMVGDIARHAEQERAA